MRCAPRATKRPSSLFLYFKTINRSTFTLLRSCKPQPVHALMDAERSFIVTIGTTDTDEAAGQPAGTAEGAPVSGKDRLTPPDPPPATGAPRAATGRFRRVPVMAGGKPSLLWGLYCACSWTWCIGMFLPVLLIERFGWKGFLAFAIPNILGCSAMGFFRRRHQPTLMAHARMLTLFSLTTIAYQVFFATWLVSELVMNLSLPAWAPPVVRPSRAQP